MYRLPARFRWFAVAATTISLCIPASAAALEVAQSQPAEDKQRIRTSDEASQTASSVRVIAQASDDEFPGIPAVGGRLSDYLDSSSDPRDRYCLELVGGEQITFTLSSYSGVDFDLYLYDSWGEQLESAVRVANPETLTYNVPVSGSYTIEARALGNSGSYELSWLRTGSLPTYVSIFGPKKFEEDGGATLIATFVKDEPVVNAAVSFESRAPGSATWTLVGQARTDSDGQAQLNINPELSAYYRARVSHGGVDYASPERLCEIDPYLSVQAPTSAIRGRSFEVTGWLRPAHPVGETPVRIRCYRKGRLYKTVWANCSRETFESGMTYTTFKTKVDFGSAGEWTITADVAQNDQHAADSDSTTVWVNRPRLSMSSSGGYTTYRRSVRLSGTLKSYRGRRMAGRKVKLEESYGGEWWSTVKTLRTDRSGRVSVSVKPQSAHYYRFTFPGDSGNSARTSEWRYVGSCYARLSNNVSCTNGWWNQTVYLTKGRHKFRNYARDGVEHVYVRNSTWRKTMNKKHIPPSRWRTYYVSVPRSGWYTLGWTGNRHYGNYIEQTVW